MQKKNDIKRIRNRNSNRIRYIGTLVLYVILIYSFFKNLIIITYLYKLYIEQERNNFKYNRDNNYNREKKGDLIYSV